jgi:hypothetical protein
MDVINLGINHFSDHLFKVSSKISTDYLGSKNDESIYERHEKKTG